MFEVVPESEMSKYLREVSDLCKKIGCTIDHIEDPTFSQAVFQVWDEDGLPISKAQHQEIVDAIIAESDTLTSSDMTVFTHSNGAVNIRMALPPKA